MQRTTFIAFLMLASTAFAQGPSAPATANHEASLMAGPTVEPTLVTRTLVTRAFNGTLTVIQDRPEFAAIELLSLDEAHRAALDAFMDERAVKVSALLHDEYELFLEIQNARQSGSDPSTLRPLMRTFAAATADLADPPLKVQMAALLPEASRPEYLSMVDEYLDALRASRLGASQGPGALQARPAEGARPIERRQGAARNSAALQQRTELVLLLGEVGRSLSGLVETRRERSDEMMKAIDATPEQEAKIRALTREVINPLREPPAREQRDELFRKIAAELSREQRTQLVRFLRDR